MKIHRIIGFPICAFLLTLMASCSENEQKIPSAHNIVLRFAPSEVATRGGSNVDPGTDEENRVSDIAVWLFPNGETTGFYQKITAPAGGVISITEDMLSKQGMTMDGTFDVYLAANLPADATLGGTSTPNELKAYTYTATARPGTPFCMAGTVLNHTFTDGHEVTVPLIRQAVKLNIKLINATSTPDAWTINSVSVRSDQRKVALFDPADGSTSASDAFGADLSVSATTTTDNPATYSTYIYENLSATPTTVVVNANVNGEDKTYLAEIKPEGEAKLPRNSECMVTLRLKDAEVIVPTDITIEIEGWGEVPINGDVTVAYLDVDKKTLSVDPVLGGEINIKSNVTKVYIDWSKASGFYLDGYSGNTHAELALTNQMVNAVFHEINSGVVADGTVSITAGNLTWNVILSHGQSDVVFELKSLHIDNIGDWADIEGQTLPWDLNGGGSNVPINIEVDQNVTWYYHLKQYYEGAPNIYNEATKTISYKGTAGASTADATMFCNGDKRPLICELNIGVMTWQSGMVVYSIKFVMEPYLNNR